MLRLAANRLCDADLVPSMLVHDGILFELDNEEQVQHAIEIMRKAGTEVCGGLEIGVDVDQKLIGGARYRDKRPVAKRMWAGRDGCAAGDRRATGGARGNVSMLDKTKSYKFVGGKFVERTAEELARLERLKAEQAAREPAENSGRHGRRVSSSW